MATTAAADTSIHGEEEETRGGEDGPVKGFEKQPPSTVVSLSPSTIFVFHLGRKMKEWSMASLGGCFRTGTG